MFKYLILACFISYSLQIDNCQETRKQCKTCINGYTAVPLDSYNIKCIKTSEYEAINEVKAHCIKGDPEAKICEKCIRDYFLDEKNNCIEHPHCFKTEGNDCFICYTPYALDKKSLKCVKKPHCDSVEEEKCIDCLSYFYPNEEGNCTRIPDEYCKYGDSNKCTECKKGYYVNSESKCQAIPFPHCQVAKSNECTYCEAYYHIEKGRCESNPQNCMDYSSYQKKCLYCGSYFHLEGEQCVSNPEHCITYSNSYCEKCDDGYYSKDNGCKYMTIKNCETLEEDSTHCKTCKEGYILNDERTQCNDLCEEYEDICDECKSNYVSYDYGKSCQIVDPNVNNFINLNLNIILLILIVFLYD
jgi:hypothetical protein